MGVSTMEEGLPVVQAAALAQEALEEGWLIRPLWRHAAVGILGGAPKSCKSWLALEFALAVASGRPCLGRFPVERPGTALVYLAEDPLPMVRARLQSLCEARGSSLAELDLHVVTAPALRLDLEEDRIRLRVTLERMRPRLLVLDPLIRCHRLDENSSKEISELLGYLRELQRTFDLAVLVVHHARKRTASSPGEALRGSSDLHAWTDVTAYLARRDSGELVLRVEHRSAQSPEPALLRLVSRPDATATHLEVLHAPAEPEPPATVEAALLERIQAADRPLTTEALREAVGKQKQKVIRVLRDMEGQGQIRRTREGWIRTPVS